MLYNIHKYIFYKVGAYILGRSNQVIPWLNGAELALRVRDLGFDSHRLHFLFIFNYFTWNAKRLSRRAGLSAIAEFLVLPV